MSTPAPEPQRAADSPTRTSPYQGLIPYSEHDAAWFFGRDRARATVLDNLLAYRLSVLYGPSGVGKSSLLRAGVVRHVRDAGRLRIAAGDNPEHAAVAYGSWAQDPVAGLKSAIRGELGQLAPALGDDLPDGSLAELVSAASQRLDGTMLIILDQFEEYFLYHAADAPFIDELARLLARRDAGASVLVSIREDALASLDALTGRLPSLLDNLVRVDHLDRRAARAAIEQPLELWNREQARPGEDVRIEPALVAAVLDGVQTGSLDASAIDGGDGVASRDSAGRASIQTPYLQLVLIRLWEEEQRTGSHVLRLQTLERLRGAEQIVAMHVDTAIAKMSVAEQAVAAKVLRQLVTPSGTKIALHSSDLAEYAELDEPTVISVLERLTREARILQAIGDSRYEIYHDALARPILDWRRRWQAEQDRVRDRRRNRTAVAVAGGLLLTVVVVGVLALLAKSGRDDARRQAADATSVALASAASDQLGSQPDVALLLALGALRTKDRPEARRSMLAARQAAGYGAALGAMRGHSQAVNAVAFVEQGRLIASAGDDGRILFWDAATHRRRGAAIAVGAAVKSIAISRDGRRLAAGAEDGRIQIWNIGSRQLLATVRHGRSGTCLAFSPDGRTLASCAPDRRASIRLWDTRAPTGPKARVDLPVMAANAVAFSPDGRTLAYVAVSGASVGGPVRYSSKVGLRSVASHRALRRPFVRDVELDGVAFSPDGRTLAISGAQTWLWSLDSGRMRRVAGAAGALALSADGRRLAVAGRDGDVRLFDLATRSRLAEPLTGPTDRLRTIAFSPDGRTLVAAGKDRKIWLLDPGFPRVLGRHVDPSCADYLAGGAASTDSIRCERFDAVAIDPRGLILATPGVDGAIGLWTADSLRAAGPPLVLDDEDAYISGLAFSRDGHALTAAGEPVQLWDLRTRRVATLKDNDPAVVVSVVVSPDGRLLASVGEDSRIVLWDVKSRRRLPAAPPRHDDIQSVAFSPDGRILASVAGGRVRLWNLTTQREVTVSSGGAGDAVHALAFSPDGQTVAAAGSGAISLWDVPTLQHHGRLDSLQDYLTGLAFTPDGRTMIAGGIAGIELFDPGALRPIGKLLRGDGFPVKQITANPDGTAFASTHGSQLRVWRHLLWRTTDELEREICALVGTGLSRAEWTQFAPGVPYRALCER